MKMTIMYKDFEHYISEVDPGSITLKTLSGNNIHRHPVVSDDPEAPTRYVFTDWVTFTLPEFGKFLRKKGFTREDAEAMFDAFFKHQGN